MKLFSQLVQFSFFFLGSHSFTSERQCFVTFALKVSKLPEGVRETKRQGCVKPGPQLEPSLSRLHQSCVNCGYGHGHGHAPLGLQAGLLGLTRVLFNPAHSLIQEG